ncbi:MAG: hypothetical protein QG577_2820 [Thermodesulfobacteriota bacterium]|nr:hypothetical protein [Thermodesulfobacteriota bacterium]
MANWKDSIITNEKVKENQVLPSRSLARKPKGIILR